MSKLTSAMGKSIDMASLRSRNEKVRAVGNMQVNARGDQIDSENRVVASAAQRVNRVYTKTTVNPSAVTKNTSTPRQSTNQSVSATLSLPKVECDEPSKAELDMFDEIDENFVKLESKSKKK